MPNTIDKNIILVGPGYLPIPVPGSNGWGGIENTLTWIVEEFENRNQQYTLINDKINYKKYVDDAAKNTNAVVHVHYDDYAPVLNFQKQYPLVATSHAPYHPYKETWNGGVYNHFQRLFSNIDAYFGQAIESNVNALELNPSLKTGLCRCGIPNYLFEKHRKDKGNRRTLVIGKIEKRKNQSIIQKQFAEELNIDFVGPLEDSDFIPSPVGKSNYLGCWSRQDVVSKMTDYSSVLLLSAFEGDVLVVKEALASGCSVALSKRASLNINTTLPFVKIYDGFIDKNTFINDIQKLNEENDMHRNDIISYFKSNFTIEVTVSQYIDSLVQLYA